MAQDPGAGRSTTPLNPFNDWQPTTKEAAQQKSKEIEELLHLPYDSDLSPDDADWIFKGVTCGVTSNRKDHKLLAAQVLLGQLHVLDHDVLAAACWWQAGQTWDARSYAGYAHRQQACDDDA